MSDEREVNNSDDISSRLTTEDRGMKEINLDEIIEKQKIGFCPPQWEETEPIEEEIIRIDTITEDYALKVVLIPERIDMERIKKDFLRKYASHEEIWDAEYFPYILYKIRGGKKGVIRPLNFNGAFQLPEFDPPSGELMRSMKIRNKKFIVSKQSYQLRDWIGADKEYLREFIEKEINGKELFYEIKGRILYHLDIEEWVATMMALWIIGTHIYFLFDSYPYIYVLGERGSGKTRMLKIITLLSRMGELWVAGRPSPLFRVAHAIKPTIAIDESEKMNEEDMGELISLLNAGYERGVSVPRTNTDSKSVEFFEVYSPKAFATTKPISPVLESRCLRIPIKRTTKMDLEERDPFNGVYRSILEEIGREISFWVIENGSEIASMDKDSVFKKYKEKFVGTPPRLLQLFMPLLCIYDYLRLDDPYPLHVKDGIIYKSETENLQKAMDYQMQEQKSGSINDSDQRILVALYHLVMSGKYPIYTKDIIDALAVDSEEEREFYTSQKIGRTLKKYGIPGQMINGHKQFFYKMSREDRVTMMSDLIKRYSIVITEEVDAENGESNGITTRYETIDSYK